MAFGSAASLQFTSIFPTINRGIRPVITDALQFNLQPERIVGGNLFNKPEFTIMKAKARQTADETILDRILELSALLAVRL